MSLTFSRSMRSLRLDSFRAARIGLALAIINMVILVAWFFFARVTLYEVSGTLTGGQEEGLLAATFSEEALGRLRQGQPAIIRLNPGPDQPSLLLPAYVYRMPESGDQVLLALQDEQLPESMGQGKLAGQVEVEVEYVTPAELVLRNTGKFLSRSPVSASSQNGQESP